MTGPGAVGNDPPLGSNTNRFMYRRCPDAQRDDPTHTDGPIENPKNFPACMHPNVRITEEKLAIGTWNVEGLTDLKIIELERHMNETGISILCLQETHRAKSDNFITDAGFWLILSGRSDDEREFAGVGFLIHPRVKRSIFIFRQVSNRLANIKIRIPGGKMTIITAYAPHAGRPFDERFEFFQNLSELWLNSSAHGPKICYGDFNARLYQRFADEHHIIGDHFFHKIKKDINVHMNRSLLLEFCEHAEICIANTFFDHPPEELVSYRIFGVDPMANVDTKHKIET